MNHLRRQKKQKLSKRAPPTILIVDDDHETVHALKLILELEGFKVQSAYTGEAALQMLEQHLPDLVLLDLLLPDISGFSVLEHLRSNRRTAKLPVIIVSALGEDADIDRMQVLGVECYLSKPFNPAELVEVVNRTVKHETRR